MSGREQSKDAIRRWSAGLGAYCGRGKLYTVDQLAEASGVPSRAIYSIMAGTYAPRWCEGMALLGVLGPTFANALFEPYGMTGLHSADAGMSDPHHHLSRMLEEAADLARKLEDGILDHQERPDAAKRLRQLGVECIEEAAALSNDRVHIFRAKKGAA